MSQAQEPSFSGEPQTETDPVLETHLIRLHQLTVYGRWFVVGLFWLLLAPPSLWVFRSEFRLWQDSFTWTAVRFAIAYHPIAAIALSFCIGLTLSVLIWQSRIILFGLSEQQRQYLQKQLFRIKQQGNSHPLWGWVFQLNRDRQ
jgi:hypothetical protein